MLQHLTGGHWGIMTRRPLESATRVLPVVAVFFLPIAIFGMKHLYGAWLTAPSTGEGALSVSEDLPDRQRLSHPRGHLFRDLAAADVPLQPLVEEQDVNREDRALRRRMKMLAGPGIILYVFVMSFAAIDWVMSLSPHWASTIYGFLFVVGQLISSMSLMIAVLVLLSRTAPMEGIIQSRHLHDLESFCSLSSCSGPILVFHNSLSSGPETCLKKSVSTHASLWSLGRRRRCRSDLPFLCRSFLFSRDLSAAPSCCPKSRSGSSSCAWSISLDDAPGVYFERRSRFDGCCSDHRTCRNLAGRLCQKFEEPAASPAGRSKT